VFRHADSALSNSLSLSAGSDRSRMIAHGCWPTRDPIGEWGEFSLYGFVGGNAISRKDRLGLATFEPGEPKIPPPSRPPGVPGVGTPQKGRLPGMPGSGAMASAPRGLAWLVQKCAPRLMDMLNDFDLWLSVRRCEERSGLRV
jgi:hypothetical protein